MEPAEQLSALNNYLGVVWCGENLADHEWGDRQNQNTGRLNLTFRRCKKCFALHLNDDRWPQPADPDRGPVEFTLDTMALAESKLGPTFTDHYLSRLYSVTSPRSCAFATKEERLECLLKTVGKWVETEKAGNNPGLEHK